jgi:hypothetical protein
MRLYEMHTYKEKGGREMHIWKEHIERKTEESSQGEVWRERLTRKKDLTSENACEQNEKKRYIYWESTLYVCIEEEKQQSEKD